MLTVKQISELVELLPERDKVFVFELAKRLIPDDVATPEDLFFIKKARKEHENGDCISFVSAEEMAAHFGVDLDDL